MTDSRPETENPVASPGPVACSIVSNNYLPFARVFAGSFLELHPEGRVFVCIVDRRNTALNYSDEPFEVVFADELGIKNFFNLAFRYSILELNTAVKPFFLQYLYDTYGCGLLCYFDPDILITSNLGELYDLLACSDIVLTPHILEPFVDRHSPGERDFLLSGCYNLGFLGLRFHARTQRFVTWWQAKLYSECLQKVDQGLFVDQRWMDLAPSFLEKAAILRDPGYNVAYWNLAHRRIQRRDAEYWVGDSRLRFFHFSGFDPDRLDGISKHQNRFALADRPDLLPLFEHYRDCLLSEGYRELSVLPYGYANFDNDIPVPPAARMALQNEDPGGERWPLPFSTSGVASFFCWLAAPRTVHSALPVPRIAWALWRMRDDLREAFPDASGADRERFIAWLLEGDDLPSIFLEALRTAWAESFEQRRQVRDGRNVEFDSGVAVPARLGQILDSLDPDGSRWPLPLSIQIPGNLYDYLLETEGADHRLPRLAHCIWRLREDLQVAFPNPESDDREPFAQWLLTFGMLEEGLDPTLLSPVRNWLDQQRRHRVQACFTAGSPAASNAKFRKLSKDDFGWAKQPAELEVQDRADAFGSRPTIPRWASILYGLRKDVQASFPQPLRAYRREFAAWLVSDGRLEFGIPRSLLSPIFQDLSWTQRLAAEFRWVVGRLGWTKVTLAAEGTAVLDEHETPGAGRWSQELHRFLTGVEHVPLSALEFERLISAPESTGAPAWVGNGRALEASANGVPSPNLVDQFREIRPMEDILELAAHSVSFLWVGKLLATGRFEWSSQCLGELLRVATPRGLVAFDVLADQVDDWTERIEIQGGKLLDRLRLDSEVGTERLVVRKVIPASPGLVQSPPRPEASLSRLVRRPPASRDWQHWLQTIDEAGNDIAPMNVFSLCLWRSNSFFQQQFPIDTIDDRYRFQFWLAWINESTLPVQDWLLGIDWHEFERPVDGLTESGEPEIRLFDWLAWTLRPDIRRTFPLDSRQSRDGFRDWIAQARQGEHAADVTRVRAKIRESGGSKGSTSNPKDRPPSSVGSFLPGVHVVEHPGATLGVLEVTHLNQLALARAGVPHTHFKFFNPQRRPDWAEQSFRYAANLIHCNADQMLRAFGELGPQLWDGRFNVGYLWWELPFSPPAWDAAFDVLDEIWVASRFVYEAFAAVSPVPVLHMPCAVRAEAEPGLGRSQFGLREDAYLFVSTFDVSSFAARKNPMATIHAFRAAFPSEDRDVGLVVKAAHASETGPLWADLRRQAAEDPRIHVINELMPRRRVLSLVNNCDAYVSLHRSEGLGLGPAEALLLGKPIVVTAFSGNMDYCSEETACLVDYELVSVEPDEYPYGKEQVWAEPSLDSAVSHLCNLRFDREGARNTAAEGRRYVRQVYSLEAVGRRYRDRLSALGIL